MVSPQPSAEPGVETPADTLPPETPAAPEPAPAGGMSREPQKLASAEPASGEDETEVDRILLAQEFSGLLQVDEDGAEGNY